MWIYGGAWAWGCQASPWYDGAAFNRDGVVTVVLSYRLSFDGYGWVDGSDVPFNRGVLDQVLALEWVRDNIAAFGGDPGAVTVGGQSAGDGNVLTLMACPRARGLFARAISESGAVTDIAADAARNTAHAMARFASVEPNLRGWRSLDYDRIFSVTADFEKRRGGPAAPPSLVERIRAAVVPGPQTSIAYGPTVDGDVLPLPVEEALARGDGAEVPLLGISTTHEFLGESLRTVEDLGARTATEVLVEAGLDEGLAAEYVAAHPELSGDERLYLGNLVSDTMFHTLLLSWAQARLGFGGAGRTWVSRFAWESPVTGWSTHCFEIPFAFDCLSHPYCERTLQAVPPQSLADAVHRDWVCFIRTGQPGWRPWDERGSGRTYGDPRGAHPDHYDDGEVFAVERRLLDAGRRLAERA